MTKVIEISVPGKIILIGEHSVVYGAPAIVAAVNKKIKAEIREVGGQYIVSAKSEIPIGIGMGSSAALSVLKAAIISAIFSLKWDLKKINDLAFDFEKEYHGRPSGVDNTVCCFGGIIRFQKQGETNRFKPLKIGQNFKKKAAKIIFINTGKPEESTREMVESVFTYSQAHPEKFRQIIKDQELLTLKTLKVIEGEVSDRELGKIIDRAEANLEALGVVSERTKKIVTDLRNLKAHPKICGAGGKKGRSGILLCFCENKKIVVDYCRKNNFEYFNFNIAPCGLKIIKTYEN